LRTEIPTSEASFEVEETAPEFELKLGEVEQAKKNTTA